MPLALPVFWVARHWQSQWHPALHIAVAMVNGVSYLVSGDCTHIANAALRPRIEAVCRRSGYEPPVICTPRELPGGEGEL